MSIGRLCLLHTAETPVRQGATTWYIEQSENPTLTWRTS
jgi:hypothetical protein